VFTTAKHNTIPLQHSRELFTLSLLAEATTKSHEE
jgi:hypothetical protein